MFAVGMKVELVHHLHGQRSHVNYGTVTKVGQRYVTVLNQHNNTCRYHSDGKAIGWTIFDNYRIVPVDQPSTTA